MESLASLSVWLPALLTFYALARWVDVPFPAHLVAAGAIPFAAVGIRRAVPRLLYDTRSTNTGLLDLALILVLIGVLSLPVIASAVDACTEFPRFYSQDEAYLLSIAQGQRLSFPPPDLLWAGATNTYHQGAALLVEGLSRLTGTSLLVAFYAIAPTLIRIAFVGASWRFLTTLFPTWSVRRRLGAIAAACGAFFVDPFAIIWNIRNLAVTQELHFATIFFGVPIAGVLPVPGPHGQFYGSTGANVLLFGAIASIGRVGPVLAGAALAASYLFKSQIGLPALGGLLFAAGVICLVAKRERLTFVLPIVVTLLLIVFIRSFGPGTGDLVVEIGLGHNLRAALSAGHPLAQALGLESDGAAIMVGLFLWTSKWAVPLSLAAVGVCAALANLDDRGRGLTVVIAMASATAALTAFATVVVITPGSELYERFVETHSDVAHLLWNQQIPFSRYLDYMFTDVSVAVANSFAALFCALLVGTALVWTEDRANSRLKRTLARLAIGAAWLAFLASMVVQAGPDHARSMERQKVVDTAAIEALEHIPIQNTITITNELAYDRNLVPHHPYLNSWAPALYGHQFWVADFMYSLHYPQIVNRFHAWKRFWNVAGSPWHEQFLKREGIGWILEKRNESVLDPGTIPAVELAFENERYRVFRFLQK